VVVKVEVEKNLKVGFIYLVALTKWFSNLVPIDKNKGLFEFVLIFEI